MEKLVVIKIDKGNFEQGFPVTLQVSDDGAGYSTEILSQLPPIPELPETYRRWQLTFNEKESDSRALGDKPAKKTKHSNRNVDKKADELSNSINRWLNSETFHPAKEKLLETLASSEEVRVLVQTNDYRLWQLPWHRWKILKDYPKVEIALSSPASKPIKRRTLTEPRKKVRILAILGDRTGINVEADKNFLQSLLTEKAEIQFLDQPLRQELYEKLWDKEGWDILFFAGHSNTDWYLNQTGRVQINSQESITIPELKSALRSAIALGLKLAIFNSCDGLGLARNLADLQIPQVIVMRETIPDVVAQAFVKDFLQRFAASESLYTSVRQARESLRELENQYPCASWLPVICENPADEPVTWEGLVAKANIDTNWEGCCRTLLALDALKRLQSNMFVRNANEISNNIEEPVAENEIKTEDSQKNEDYKRKGMEIEEIYVPTSLEFVKEQPLTEDEQKQADNFPETYKQIEFFQQAIASGKTPKSRGKRLAIIGEPGAGKSRLLQEIGDWLMWEDDRNADRVVIQVSLADLRRGQTLENYLLKNWLIRAKESVNISSATEESLKGLFEQGKVWLLLDAVDEMSVYSGSPLFEVTRQISASFWISQAKIVLTCRVNVWEANKVALQSFDVYRNSEFTYNDKDEFRDQVEQFIWRWFAKNLEQGKQLRQALDAEGKQRIKDLAKNPLRLSLLCQVWQSNGKLPDTKAELYKQFVEAIYKWKSKFLWKKIPLNSNKNALKYIKEEFKYTIAWKEPIFRLDEDKIRGLNKDLAKLAKLTLEYRQPSSVKLLKWAIQKQKLINFPPSQKALEIVSKTRASEQESPFRIPHSIASSILSPLDLRLALDLGWLIQVGVSKNNSKEPVYAFFHPIFHEYFAAQAIDSNEWDYFLKHDNNFITPLPFGRYRIFEEQWREVILLWFGRPSDEILDQSKIYFLETLCKFNDLCQGFYSFQALFLAAAALAEFPRCQNDLANKIIAKVIKLSISYFNNEQDCNLPFEAHKERAKIVLEQTDIYRAKASIEAIISKMSRQPEYLGFRIAAAVKLAKIDPGNQVAIDIFLEWMVLEDDKSKRYYASKWLIKTARGNQRVIEILNDHLSDATLGIDKLKLIALTLGIISNQKSYATKSIEFLLKRLKFSLNENEFYVLNEKFEEIALENSLVTELVVIRLTEFLTNIKDNSENSNLFLKDRRLCAAEALLGINPRNTLAIDTLVELSAVFSDDSVGEIALRALTRYGVNEPAIVKALLTIIDSLASEQLENNEQQQLIAEQKQRIFFCKVLEALEKTAFSNSAAIKVLSQKLKNAKYEPWIYLRIAGCLGKIDPRNQEAIQALVELNELSSDIALQKSAAEKLGEIDLNNRIAIRTLINIFQTNKILFLNLVKQLDLNPKTASSEIYKREKDRDRTSGQWEMLKQASEAQFQLWDSVRRLREIAQGDKEAIDVLTKSLQIFQDERLQQEIAETLGSIDPGNSYAIAVIAELYENFQDSKESSSVLSSARHIAKKAMDINDWERKLTVIHSLETLLQRTQDAHWCMLLAESLGQIDPGNQLAISTLLNLLADEREPVHYSQVVASFRKILRDNRVKIAVRELVTRLKVLLFNTKKSNTEKSDSRFEAYFHLAWHCAELLSYPEFFQSWHNLSIRELYHPRLFINILIYFGLSFRFKVEYYLRHTHHLLIDLWITILPLIGRVFYLIIFSLFVLSCPIWLPLMFISYLSKRFLNFDILVTLFYIAASVLGLAIGVILPLGFLALIIGLPFYLIYRLIAWIFGW